jgi:hypothetical protein
MGYSRNRPLLWRKARCEPRQESNAMDTSWCVKRLDDNGNEIVLQANLSREQAERLARDYQSRGHKQSYWACRQVTNGAGGR